MAGSLPRQIPQLSRDFGVDVQRLLAARDAAAVAGLDELADLLDDRRIPRDRIPPTPRELGQLGLHVPRLAAVGGPQRVAGLEHLADLVVALRAAGRRVLAVERHPAAADV